MLLTQHNWPIAVAACYWAIATGGCSVPWTTPISETANVPAVPSASSLATNDAARLRVRSAERSFDLSEDSQIVNAAAPDLTGVLDKLQQIRQIDPAAEQKLLDELRRTPAESWPLVAEQFRASLAYREQLATSRRRTPQGGEGYAEALAAMNVTADHQRAVPIGVPADPRQADSTSATGKLLADSTPNSVPAAIDYERETPGSNNHIAPATFKTDAIGCPIDSHMDRRSENATPAVVHARFDSAERAASSVDVEVASGIESTNQANSVTDESNWLQHVEMAAADLGRRAAKSPTTTAEVHQHVSLRILHLLTGDTEKALEPIPHISPNEQDYWSRQLFALATYLDHHSQPDDKRRAAASVTHLDEAVANLRELGSLSVRNLSFCKNVYGYGAIEPYDTDSFSSGEQVSLYVEVENFHSRSTEKGYCTLLGSTYEILSDKGVRVGGGEMPDVDDCCRSRRRDFHIQYGLTLPEKLVPGRYRLQLVVKDRQSDKIGHATTSFEIRGAAQ